MLGHVFGDGEWALIHRDRAVTASLLDDAYDGDAWLELCDLWDRIGADLIGSLLTPFPPVRHGVRLGALLARAGGLGTVRDLLTPAYDLAQSRFRGRVRPSPARRQRRTFRHPPAVAGLGGPRPADEHARAVRRVPGPARGSGPAERGPGPPPPYAGR